jgi:hypothetical protein
MANGEDIAQNFKLEGTREGLRHLVETINQALQSDQRGEEKATAQATLGPLNIEVRVLEAAGVLAVRPGTRDEAAMLLEGWAENVRCANCEIPVALLFEEEYLESSTGRGAVCARCMEEELDEESV